MNACVVFDGSVGWLSAWNDYGGAGVTAQIMKPDARAVWLMDACDVVGKGWTVNLVIVAAARDIMAKVARVKGDSTFGKVGTRYAAGEVLVEKRHTWGCLDCYTMVFFDELFLGTIIVLYRTAASGVVQRVVLKL